MQMPFRIRQVDKKNVWRCNDDPRRVADFYNRFLGQGGESMLNEETRWLAITHKSYDQGRRGFNDRLSYMGT
jgi:large subunit ribosomal protein L15